MVIRNRTNRQSQDKEYNGYTKQDQKTIIEQRVQWSYEIELTENRRTDSAMVIRNRLTDNRRTDSNMVIRNRTKRQSQDGQYNGDTKQDTKKQSQNRQYNGHTKQDQKTIIEQTVQWSYEIGPKDNRRTDKQWSTNHYT